MRADETAASRSEFRPSIGRTTTDGLFTPLGAVAGGWPLTFCYYCLVLSLREFSIVPPDAGGTWLVRPLEKKLLGV